MYCLQKLLIHYFIKINGLIKMNLAPIALFVYNRLDHTEQTVSALKRNVLAEESDLFVFSDAPKDSDLDEKIKAVREFIASTTGFKSLTIIERPHNLGLANSIIDGVTNLCNKYGQVIVLEDDLVTSPFFLKYMNDALDFYRDEERVISIHGYIYPLKAKLPETFFLRGADCWGWATWKRGWDIFEPNGEKLLEQLKQRKLEKQFNFDGAYEYVRMLKNQILKKNDSWAIRWHASAFLNDSLTLYSGKSLVNNIGNDSSGTHSGSTSEYDVILNNTPVEIKQIAIMETTVARNAIIDFFFKNKPSIMAKVKRRIRNYCYFQ